MPGQSRIITRQKIDEYIELLNSGYKPKYYDYETSFTTGDGINHFWPTNKNKIIYILNSEPKYQVGYETAKKNAINLAKETPRQIKMRMLIEEYIELLNHGYIPKKNDPEAKFQNGEIISHFWAINKDKITRELNSNPKYDVGYDTAKNLLKELKNKKDNITFAMKLSYYIELLNKGYQPKYLDLETKFQDGKAINRFWKNNKDKIIDLLNNDLKYAVGYETAKKTVIRFLNEKPKQIEIKMHIDEYIELMNIGYLPKAYDTVTKFQNGSEIKHFWTRYKYQIISEFNNNPKYQVGYETALNIINQLSLQNAREIIFEQKIDEYIELVNNGYIPKNCDQNIKFKNGDFINNFWSNNKAKIIDKFISDPKYQVGYETAQDILEPLKPKEVSNILFEKKLSEYIELLNKGYIPRYCDYETKFKDGEAINRFWSVNKNKIIYKLNNDPNYNTGYETAKMTLNKMINQVETKVSNKPKKVKISKKQILNYLGIELEKEIYYPIKDIIKSACFNQHVSRQNTWIKEAYQDTLDKLDKLITLDEDKIANIVSREIIENCLEKEEREEFKKAILSYLEKVKELQKLDVAFEEDNEKRSEKIKGYNFDEFDIEECVLISLEFDQAKFIEPRTDLYKRRKLISSYIIDWDEFTTEEKDGIIKQNNFTENEISLINEKQEEIKVLKKLI